MKKLVLISIFALLVATISANAQCCGTKVADLTKPTSMDQTDEASVKAYYFHATRRCVTCQAVETVTKEALKEYYGGKVVFQSIDRDEDSKNPLIKKYKVNGQTLLIVNGDKAVNLTNDAFLNARTNPDKLKAKIKSTIDPMI
jgi:hypothetical protein